MSEQALRAALQAILAVEVDSNSEPDAMAEALSYIADVAQAALAGQALPEPPVGAARLTTVTTGQRVYWHDPDDDIGSGPGTVVSVFDAPVDAETVIELQMDSGSWAEVVVGELSALDEA